MAGQGARKGRLTMFAERLRPAPEISPYYLHNPAGDELHRSPGWYMKYAGEVVYLGYSAGDAEQELRGRLPRRSKRKRSLA